MGSIISNLIEYFYPSKNLFFTLKTNEKTRERELKDKVDKELEKWIVKQYAENSYLMKIPQIRISQKRNEIKEKLLK